MSDKSHKNKKKKRASPEKEEEVEPEREEKEAEAEEQEEADDSEEENESKEKKKSEGRKKVPVAYIAEKTRRQTTFSKRKSGLIKKGYELSTLTGAQCAVIIASETGHIYSFASSKFQKMITTDEGKAWIQSCLQGSS